MGKKQPGSPGRLSEAKGKSSRKLEEVAKMEGDTPAKKQWRMTRSKNSDQVNSISNDQQRQRQRQRKKQIGG